MRVTIQKGGILSGLKVEDGVDMVLIESDEGAPLALAVKREDRVWMSTVDEARFAEALQALGLGKRLTAKVDTVNLK